MKCPFCGGTESRVIETSHRADGSIRRRRECEVCKGRFTTYERVAPPRLRVVKADGRREEFQREKLLAGVLKACAKRPIPTEVIEGLVGEIEGELYRRGEREVESRVIGEMVMERLRELDDVAYVRFASVYRRFADVGSLAEEIENLLERKRKEEEMRRQLRLGL